jgi:hypothetical protein
MKASKILTPLGFYGGVNDGKHQYYQLHMEDTDGNLFVCSFGCKVYLKDTIEKYFGKLFPVPAPIEEKVEAKDAMVGTEDLINQQTKGLKVEPTPQPMQSKSIFD